MTFFFCCVAGHGSVCLFTDWCDSTAVLCVCVWSKLGTIVFTCVRLHGIASLWIIFSRWAYAASTTRRIQEQPNRASSHGLSFALASSTY